jgi:RimJ/RimL family protein N-acetyltransferase
MFFIVLKQKIERDGLNSFFKVKYLKLLVYHLVKIVKQPIIIQKMLVHEQLLSPAIHVEPTNIPISFKFASSISELKSLIDQREEWYCDYATKKINEGCECYYGIVEDQIVCCMWIAYNNLYMPEVEYLFQIDNKAAFTFDGWTAPNFRRKGIFSHLRLRCLNELKEKKSCKRVIGHILCSNKASINVQKKLNAAYIIMTITLVKVIGMKIHLKDEKKIKFSRYAN